MTEGEQKTTEPKSDRPQSLREKMLQTMQSWEEQRSQAGKFYVTGGKDNSRIVILIEPVDHDSENDPDVTVRDFVVATTNGFRAVRFNIADPEALKSSENLKKALGSSTDDRIIPSRSLQGYERSTDEKVEIINIGDRSFQTNLGQGRVLPLTNMNLVDDALEKSMKKALLKKQ